MNITRILTAVLLATGLTCFTNAQTENCEASTPSPAQLSRQLKAIKEMLSVSNATETLSLRRDEATKLIHGLNEAERQLRYQSYEDALLQVNAAMDFYSGGTNNPFYCAVQQFKTDTSSFISATGELLAAEGKKLEEEAPVLFATAKSPDDILTFKSKIEEFRTRSERFFSKRSSRSSTDQYNQFSTLTSLATEWARVLTELQSGDIYKAMSTLQNLKSSYGQTKLLCSPAMLKRVAEIEKTHDDSIAAAIAKLKDACIKAETAEELDKALEEFNAVYMKNQSSLYSNSTRGLQSKMERMQQAARQWTRVLVAVEKESYQEAVQMISSMESDSYSNNPLFSRKELSEKKAELLKKSLKSPKKETDPILMMVNDMMGKVTSIEGLSAIKQMIQNVSRSGYSQNDLQYLVSDITSLEAVNEAVKNGQFGTVFQSYAYRSSEGYQHRWKPVLDKYRTAVRHAAIGGLCEIKDFEVGKDETAEKVLQSYIDKAASKKQWDLVLKYLDAYRQIFASSGGYNYASWLTDETAAVRSFMTARNFEKAEEYERALLNYMAVLNSASKRAPIEEATEAIKKIKKNHPDAYEKASKISLSAPTPTLPLTDGSRILRSGF